MNIKAKHFLIAIGFSLLFFLILGIPTALVPTSFFARMIPPTIIDYVLLVLTAAMAGSYASYSLYVKNRTEEKSTYVALGGVFSGVFSFGCPICNTLLVMIFGSTALLVYFEPYRYHLSLITIGLFALAFYWKRKKCRECNPN